MTPTAPRPFDAFVLSLDQEEATAFSTPMLRSIWHGLRGEWHVAHELEQTQDDADGAWVHASLHGTEVALSNADYWYRRGYARTEYGFVPVRS